PRGGSREEPGLLDIASRLCCNPLSLNRILPTFARSHVCHPSPAAALCKLLLRPARPFHCSPSPAPRPPAKSSAPTPRFASAWPAAAAGAAATLAHGPVRRRSRSLT